MGLLVRRARPGDAAGIAGVHIRAWQTAYRGAMPDAYLDGLSEADRAAAWSRQLNGPWEREPVLVAEDAGVILGFAASGEARDYPGSGELYAINVEPDRWRTGAGRALLQAATRELGELGFDRAILWVLPSNERARRFYETAGWKSEAIERTADVLGVSVPEIRYARTLTRD